MEQARPLTGLERERASDGQSTRAQSAANAQAPVHPAQLQAAELQAHVSDSSSGDVVQHGGLSNAAMQANELRPSQIRAHAAAGVSGQGQSLPHLGAIQQSFGQHDVTGISAHVGGRAGAANEAMGAEAYARGHQVAFKSSPSLHTAAHEAAHVVQQRRGVEVSDGVGQPGDGYERNADAVADRVVQGKSSENLLGAPTQGSVSSDQAPVQGKGNGKGTAKPKVSYVVKPDEYMALYRRIQSNTTGIRIYENTGTRLKTKDETYSGFRFKMLRSLLTLCVRRAGFDLVKSLADGGQMLELRPLPKKEWGKKAFADALDVEGAHHGKGSSTVVYIHPYMADTTLRARNEQGFPIPQPVFIVLGHELIHAKHNQEGEKTPGKRDDTYHHNEEYAAITGGHHMHQKGNHLHEDEITENLLRKQFGLPPRYGHDGPESDNYTKSVKEIKAGR